MERERIIGVPGRRFWGSILVSLGSDFEVVAYSVSLAEEERDRGIDRAYLHSPLSAKVA